MLGDATLFTRADEVEEQWALVDAIVAAWQRDRPNVPELRGRDLGAAARRRADPPRRALLAAALMPCVVAEVERELARAARCAQRADGAPDLRTSVMTHIAWAPPQWAAAARRTLAGLEELHPSRTILLFPDAARARTASTSRVDAAVLRDRRCRARGLLGGDRAPARRRARRGARLDRRSRSSISDLPAFCRWRGEPPWGEPELEQLVDVCDRLVVDSSEWRGLPGAYEKLAALFDRVAVSDIAWGRGVGWRGRLAALWPEIKTAKTPVGDGAEGGRAPPRRLAALAARRAVKL